MQKVVTKRSTSKQTHRRCTQSNVLGRTPRNVRQRLPPPPLTRLSLPQRLLQPVGPDVLVLLPLLLRLLLLLGLLLLLLLRLLAITVRVLLHCAHPLLPMPPPSYAVHMSRAPRPARRPVVAPPPAPHSAPDKTPERHTHVEKARSAD